jgi:hypothetical protein
MRRVPRCTICRTWIAQLFDGASCRSLWMTMGCPAEILIIINSRVPSGIAHIRLADEDFGNHEDLCRHLDQETAHFVRLSQRLYSRSLGPWCVVEVLSVDWMRALGEALSVHFPQFIHEPYFEDCFSQRVEERHADEALAVTEIVLRQRPELVPETLRDAKLMAEALDAVWHNLDRIIQQARRRTIERGRFSLIINRLRGQ